LGEKDKVRDYPDKDPLRDYPYGETEYAYGDKTEYQFSGKVGAQRKSRPGGKLDETGLYFLERGTIRAKLDPSGVIQRFAGG